MQQENELISGKGLRWEWFEGSPESMTPFLVLDFNVALDPERYKEYKKQIQEAGKLHMLEKEGIEE